jgi:hypothetical protein
MDIVPHSVFIVPGSAGGRRHTDRRRQKMQRISLRGWDNMPVADIIVLVLVALCIAWVAVATIRSNRRASQVKSPTR